jgi:hypothetical protein
MTTTVTIVLTHRPDRWDAFLAGERIVSASRDPEHDAARALLARGMAGPFETAHADGRPRMRFASIEATAGRMVSEEGLRGLKLRRWKPFSVGNSEATAA